MRVIKFRAYDREKKIMIHDQQQGLDNHYPGMLIGAYIPKTVRRIGEAYETYMQFTGLTDKNGKDIYEYDYISWLASKGRFCREEDVGKLFLNRGMIRYNGDEMRWEIKVLESDHAPMNHCIYPDVQTDNNNFEVFGNFYENKDILNG